VRCFEALVLGGQRFAQIAETSSPRDRLRPPRRGQFLRMSQPFSSPADARPQQSRELWCHVEDIAEWDADRLRYGAEHGTMSAPSALCQALADALSTQQTDGLEPATVAGLSVADIVDAIGRVVNQNTEMAHPLVENLVDAAQRLLRTAEEVERRMGGCEEFVDGCRDQARKLMYLAVNVVDAPTTAPRVIDHVVHRDVVRDPSQLHALMCLGVMAECVRPNGYREYILSDGSLLAEAPDHDAQSTHWVLEAWAPARRVGRKVIAGRLQAQ
jgi:hypothetical protein